MGGRCWIGLALLLISPGCSSDPAAAGPGADAGTDPVAEDAPGPEADASLPEAEPSETCGVVETPGDACQACTLAHCCDRTEACAQEPDCQAYLDCVEPCAEDDDACVEDCIVKHPAGYTVGSVLAACEAHECWEPCGVPVELACGRGWGDAACDACSAERCCVETYAAGTNLDARERAICLLGCPLNDDNCANDCNERHAEGFAATYTALNCSLIECVDECAGLFGEPLPCGLGLLTTGYSAGCTECAKQNCCDVFQGKSLSDAYWRSRACAWACGTDLNCWEACNKANLEGMAWTVVAEGCTATHCQDACEGEVGGACGSIIMTDAYCDKCAQENCCDTMTAIGTSLDAVMHMNCQNYCLSDQACKAQCSMRYPEGYVMQRLNTTCLNLNCECGPPSACGLYRDDGSACVTCVEQSCCDEAVACATDADCQRIEVCRELNRCLASDTACNDACRAAHPEGVAVFDAAFGCRQSACGVDCVAY